MGRAGLMLVIFSLGCTTPKAAEKPAEPAKSEPVAEPAKTEPAKTEPVAEPAKTEPVAEPVKTEPVAEPVKTEPAKTEPVKTEPVKTEPAKTPTKTEPVKTEPAKTPVKTEPVKTEPVKTEPVKTEPAKVAEPDAKIARMWKSKCGSCHGADGKAATTKGKKMLLDDMSTKAWQAANSDAEIKKAITDGVKKEKNGVSQEMDAFSELSAADVAALVQYVRWLGPH